MERRNLLKMALSYSGLSMIYPSVGYTIKQKPWSIRMADSDIKRNTERWMIETGGISR